MEKKKKGLTRKNENDIMGMNSSGTEKPLENKTKGVDVMEGIKLLPRDDDFSVEGKTLGELTSLLFTYRTEKAMLEEKKKETQRVIDVLTYKIIELMDNAGIDKHSVSEGTISRTVKLYPRIADRDAFIDWVVKNEDFSMLVARVNEASFRSYFNEHNEYPDGVEAYEKETLNVRRR